MKVDHDHYQRQKETLGEDVFYGKQNTILHGLHKDTKEGIDRMVTDLEKQYVIFIIRMANSILRVFLLRNIYVLFIIISSLVSYDFCLFQDFQEREVQSA